MEFPDYFVMAGLEQLQSYNDSLFSGNFSGGSNQTEGLLPTGVKLTIVVVYMIVCVVGLVGNFLVMYVVIRSVGRPSWKRCSGVEAPAHVCASALNVLIKT